jgi:type I restriction enzyme S subunit
MSAAATADTVRFGDVVNEVKSHEKSPLVNGVERVVGLEHLDPLSLRITRWGDVRDGTTFTKRFEPGHILFGKRRCYQKKAGVPDFSGICSGDIIVMAADPEHLDPELLPFLVQSDAFFEWAEKTSSGSLSPRTKFKSLADFKFPLPLKDRQREILEVLQALEDSLRSTEDAIEAAEQLKRSLMATLLTKGIGHTKFKKTEIGEIPEEWEAVTLESLLADVTPAMRCGPFGSSLRKSEADGVRTVVWNLIPVAGRAFYRLDVGTLPEP